MFDQVDRQPSLGHTLDQLTVQIFTIEDLTLSLATDHGLLGVWRLA